MSDVNARYLGLTANQLAKIATDLKAENAGLIDEIDHLLIKQQHIEDVNTKLRELVAEMFNACPMCAKCAHNHLTVGWYDRMRSLGIEVD